MVARYEPGLVSEHLAWSMHRRRYLSDLLPLPYTDRTLTLVCAHVDKIQSKLRRRILLENPSTYLRFAGSTLAETEFLADAARRTGCGLLLDVNNVMVSCTNHHTSPQAYVDGPRRMTDVPSALGHHGARRYDLRPGQTGGR